MRLPTITLQRAPVGPVRPGCSYTGIWIRGVQILAGEWLPHEPSDDRASSGNAFARKVASVSKNPTVCIVESLGFLEEQTLREGEIISKTLQLSGKRSAYVYIKSVPELMAVASEFGDSSHRYLHLSCHGSIDDKDRMEGLALTTGRILNAKLVALLKPHLDGRRLFLSSCLAARGDFAETLMEQSGCLSVLAPMNKIGFDDAAVFWTAFYHLMFKEEPRDKSGARTKKRRGMSNRRIEENVGTCARLVNERFRLFLRGDEKGEVRRVTIGPRKE